MFLAGDAGHNTPPVGGQGMNAGIHDADGLQDTPALVLVRPDGHIAFRGGPKDNEDLARHVRHLAAGE